MTDMSDMFEGATEFNDVYTAEWDTTKIGS